MQLRCEPFVLGVISDGSTWSCRYTDRMQLKRQRLCYRKDLGKIWELGVVELFGNGLANKLVWVLVEDMLEIFAG
jgi:hypothetical protein